VNGNYNVILCERGIRTFETATRFTMDLNAVPVLRHFDAFTHHRGSSHGSESRVHPALAKASVAVGADGLILEVHRNREALSDGPQSLVPEQFRQNDV